MKRTFSSTNLALTALCAAMLAACGGGGNSDFLGENSKNNNFGGGSGGKSLDPINKTTPTIEKFLVNMAGEGQQTKNIVTSVDDDKNGRINYGDAVRFNQPGAISCITTASSGGSSSSGSASGSTGSGGGSCGNAQFKSILGPLEDQLNTANSEKAVAQNELDEAKGKLEAAQKDTNNPPSAAQLQALQDAVNAATTKLTAATEKANAAQRALDSRKDTLSSSVSMLDINGELHTVIQGNTIDFNGQKVSRFLSHDVGVRKIDAERKVENGQTFYNRGGSIHRGYNGILLFSNGNTNNPNGYVDIYLRDPAAAGLSYTTFGAYSSKFVHGTRDVNIGYQSIGQKVTELPTAGSAKYTGLGHAYISDLAAERTSGVDKNQVTMDVVIDANFGGRSLSFNTNNSYIHTYETLNGVADQHIIQHRPDLNLHGSASWNPVVGDFTGQVRNEGGNLTGKIEGSFYGPKAAEVGGVFGLSGQDALDPNSKTHRVHYVGGFAAQRD
ncbi:MAG: transferrin-binding protein-like solute binding protein [Cardiobacteriaceae bacterium]|nr:transferrin-binding protein-like solute binding protein [Cardiobacteriaceae bacterium]